MIACLDLWCAEYADGTFDEPVCVSAEGNGLAKSLYDVAAQNGVVSVIWTENSENDLFNSSETNTLYLRSCVNGIWQDTVSVTGTTDHFMDADVSLENGSPKVVYRTTQDGSVSAISVFDNGSTSVIESEGNLANVERLRTKLYYLKGNTLYEYDGVESTATNLTGIDNFSILQNGNRTAAVTLKKDGDAEEFWRSDRSEEDGVFGPFYQITDFGKHIRSYQAEMDDAGSVILLANQVELTGNEEDPYGRADIVLWSQEGKSAVIEFIDEIDTTSNNCQ